MAEDTTIAEVMEAVGVEVAILAEAEVEVCFVMCLHNLVFVVEKKSPLRYLMALKRS